MMRSLATSFILALCAVLPSVAQTDGVQTLQGIQIERAAAPGTYITINPPTSAITGYTLIWPATPPTAGQALVVTSSAAPWQLGWSNSAGSTIELVASVNGNLRRIEALNQGGIMGTPGNYANDFQGERSNGTQTASGNYSMIGGGARNTASGNYSLVLGGESNTSSGQHSVIAGGQNNTSSGSGSAILGGSNNTNAGANAALGGGSSNTITAAGTRGFLGGGQNNTVSASDAVVLGGSGNTASGVFAAVGGGSSNTASDTAAVVGGGQNNVASGRRSAIIGGQNNTASGLQSFIGGGTSNTASGANTVVGGGNNNSASGTAAAIGSGENNVASAAHSFVGGGQANQATTGTHSVVGGGQSNVVSGSHSVVGGGLSNTVASNWSVVPGGRNMTLAAGSNGSFGFNSGDNLMSVADPGTFVIANSDLWIANNNNTTRELRFYEAYNTAGAFPSATNYVAFKAANSMANNNTYTLPTAVGAVNQVLRIATVSGSDATLEWADGVTTVRANTVTVTADNQAISAAQMNNITYLRLDSDNTPVNRTVTLANGVTSGQRLIIRCVATAGNGIEINDAANVEVNGLATLNNLDTIMFIWDGTSNVWVEIARTDI